MSTRISLKVATPFRSSSYQRKCISLKKNSSKFKIQERIEVEGLKVFFRKVRVPQRQFKEEDSKPSVFSVQNIKVAGPLLKLKASQTRLKRSQSPTSSAQELSCVSKMLLDVISKEEYSSNAAKRKKNKL